MSHPSRVRGLKPSGNQSITGLGFVAPLAGAWIETGYATQALQEHRVAPLAGAWIETSCLETRTIVSGVAPLAGAWIET